MAKKRVVWHKGPPPSVGWWPASMAENLYAIRWWDGKCWSLDCYAYQSGSAVAARQVLSRDDHQKWIEWTDRPADWPERSRT